MNHLYRVLLVGLWVVATTEGCSKQTNSSVEVQFDCSYLLYDEEGNFTAQGLVVSNNCRDLPINEYKIDELHPIRRNFEELNRVGTWVKVETVELWNTTEGGVLLIYYSEKGLEKMIAREYGEMGQILRELYLMDGQLSFVYEKQLHYNHPINLSPEMLYELSDSSALITPDQNIIEFKSYFADSELIHRIESEDCGPPFAKEYMKLIELEVISIFQSYLSDSKGQ